jgi:dolichyl-diphosphooligosaccharide--protein glycosyltransferase
VEKSKPGKLILLLVSILIPLAVGFYVRFDDLNIWEKYKNQFYYQDRPLFTSYDAFYFARYGKEYREGDYKGGKPDPLRFFPDNYITNNVTYPQVIPMESWLGAEIASLKKTHIENVALWLSPLLGVLFILPLTMFFWELSLPVSGFSGALLGVISLLYLVRTSVCRFDTDSLNLFFPFIAAYFFLKTLTCSSSRKKVVYAALGGISLNLFNWWYAHPGLITASFVVYLMSLFFFKYKNLERLDFIAAGIAFLLANPLVLISGFGNAVNRFLKYTIIYSEKSVHGGFPNVQMSISELKHFSLKTLSNLSAGNEILLIIGLVGAILFFLVYWRVSVLLLPVFLIGFLTFKGANRFAMYLSPFIGVGIGFFIDFALNRMKNKKFQIPISFLALTGITAVFCLVNVPSFRYVAKPKITPALAGDFLKLQEVTPKNSQIWTWWDYGYAIQYYGERGTFHDGGSQYSPKTYFIATTFSIANPEQAYNTILAVSSLGATGIRKLLEERGNPKVLRNEIFSGKYSKPLKRTIYWAFTEDETGKFAWINYFGTWNFDLKKGIKSPVYQLSGCKSLKPDVLVCGGLIIDLGKGKVIQNRRSVPLKKLVIKNRDKLMEKSYHSRGLYFEIVEENKKNYLFLMAEQPYRSMFNQMYILRNFDTRYFELVYNDFPTMVLYRVRNE